MTPETLRAFEQRVAEAFNAKQIRAPVHLAGGNEDNLIEIFKMVRPQDWVLSQWRSHYHCLLKGVPPEQLYADILAGRSITLTYPEHRILTSAIVGGILPIGLGIAWTIKRLGLNESVWCFVGDMTMLSGIAHECVQYAANHGLPFHVVIEDNGKSVDTPTAAAWGDQRDDAQPLAYHYRYDLSWPHSGAGTRINF